MAQTPSAQDRIRRSCKMIVLYAAKFAGFFLLSQWLTRSMLRILCYHGFSVEDENEFRPKLFISGPTLRKRLAYIAKKKNPVMNLEEALNKLDEGTLPRSSIVITIDDGFHTTYSVAWPLLKEFGFPATVYPTSYYVMRGNPVFRLAIQYLFWKTRENKLLLDGLNVAKTGTISLSDPQRAEREIWEFIRWGEEHQTEEQRTELLKTLSERLQVDWARVVERRMLGLLSPAEIQEMAEGGVDFQLHTHRHRFPEEETVATHEILDNRAALERLAKRRLNHFCYPSGLWSERYWPWLSALGIQSATTCEQGLNTRFTPKLALRRFLDGENISQIEFEGELSGFSDCLRRLRARLGSYRVANKAFRTASPDPL
jgi:peptidoglycan/xylan/chitin deacetylase (PgdA/CDA1 family)